jgi:protein phosphatase PTC7
MLKQVPRLFSQLAFKGSRFMIPHFAKVDRGGEDAFTASPFCLAVADGVGGWANMGIDPGIYSRKLISNIELQLKENL